MSFEAGKKSIFSKDGEDHDPVETFVEMTSDNIHYYLEDVINGQTHYRLVSLDTSSLLRTLAQSRPGIMPFYNFKTAFAFDGFVFSARGQWTSFCQRFE